jgi:hypothetical protein
MASNWETGGKIASIIAPFAKETVSYLSDINGQHKERNAAIKTQEALRSTGLFPKASKEEELAQTYDIANKYALEGPQYRKETVKQDTMTPWQQTASNLSLLGSAPGQFQKAVPGFLPAAKKYGGRAGAFLNELFGPQTGHLDEYAKQQLDDFEDRIVPQINAKYGPGEEVARDIAIASARTGIQKEIVGMKAKAYESGLERNLKGSQELFEAGLKPQFKYGEQNVEIKHNPGESPSERAIQESYKIKNPLTRESQSPEQFIDQFYNSNQKLGKGKVGESLKKDIAAKKEKLTNIYKNGSVAQKQAISKVLSQVPVVGGVIQEPTIFKDLNKAEDFEKYYQVTNYGDPEVAELAKIISNGKDLDTLYAALKGATDKDKKIVQKLAVKYGLAEEKSKKNYALGITAGLLTAAPIAIAAGAALAEVPFVKTALEGVYGLLTTGEKSQETKEPEVEQISASNTRGRRLAAAGRI